MSQPKTACQSRIRGRIGILSMSLDLLFAWHFYAHAQNKSDFPDGYDAVQAAPGSHKVIFENAFVRVLQLTLNPGTTIPMHHHRWPSFFLSWDTGGKSPHVLYQRPDGSVRDNPSVNQPIHPGRWSIQWMSPEPMHSIKVLEVPESAPNSPADLRIEIKCHP